MGSHEPQKITFFTTWWIIPLSKYVISPVISGLTLQKSHKNHWTSSETNRGQKTRLPSPIAPCYWLGWRCITTSTHDSCTASHAKVMRCVGSVDGLCCDVVDVQSNPWMIIGSWNESLDDHGINHWMLYNQAWWSRESLEVIIIEIGWAFTCQSTCLVDD